MSSDEKALYRYHEQLLDLTPPWRVTDFKLDVAKSRLDIHVEWPKDGAPVHCPECDELYQIHDHRDERTWRHLDTMQLQTFLHCQVPRADCPTHGVGTVKTPWSGKNSRFTLFFERLAIDMLLAARNITKACELLKISWDQLVGPSVKTRFATLFVAGVVTEGLGQSSDSAFGSLRSTS